MMMSREERFKRLREIYADVDTPEVRAIVDGNDTMSPAARSALARIASSSPAMRSAIARKASLSTRPEGGISDKAAIIMAEALKSLLRS